MINPSYGVKVIRPELMIEVITTPGLSYSQLLLIERAKLIMLWIIWFLSILAINSLSR